MSSERDLCHSTTTNVYNLASQQTNFFVTSLTKNMVEQGQEYRSDPEVLCIHLAYDLVHSKRTNICKVNKVASILTILIIYKQKLRTYFSCGQALVPAGVLLLQPSSCGIPGWTGPGHHTAWAAPSQALKQGAVRSSEVSVRKSLPFFCRGRVVQASASAQATGHPHGQFS